VSDWPSPDYLADWRLLTPLSNQDVHSANGNPPCVQRHQISVFRCQVFAVASPDPVWNLNVTNAIFTRLLKVFLTVLYWLSRAVSDALYKAIAKIHGQMWIIIIVLILQIYFALGLGHGGRSMPYRAEQLV